MTTSKSTHQCLDQRGAMADNAMASGIRSIWSQDQLLDLTIHVENQSFKVHKLAIAAMSDFFRAMLTGDMIESQRDAVDIQGVTAVAMEKLIAFMYTNELDITKENAVEILAGAMYLQIPTAIKTCTQYIVKNLDVDNWVDVLKLFTNYNLMDAVEHVKNYLKRDIRDIVKTIAKGQLSLEELQFFIAHWQSSEYELFEFIREWVVADAVLHQRHCNDLLHSVRYCLMTIAELLLIKESHCNSHDPWCGLIDRALEYHKLPMHQRVLYDSKQTTIRSNPSFVMFSSAIYPDAGCFYEPLKERRFVKCDKLKAPTQFGTCCNEIEVNNFLFVICAQPGVDAPQDFRMFDPISMQWATLGNLPRYMQETALVHDDQHIYAVGGEGMFYEPLSDINQYDFQSDTWSNFSSLPMPVKYFGACILGNHLYVLGGEIEEEYAIQNGLGVQIPPLSDKVDRLDLSTQQWESRAKMYEARDNHLANVMEIMSEKVICIFDETFNLEYYNPTHDQWSKCSFSFNAPLPLRRPVEEEEKRKEWVIGNSFYISDVTTMFSEGRNACVVVKFPENGLEATVDILHEYKGEFDENGSYISVLAIAQDQVEHEV